MQIPRTLSCAAAAALLALAGCASNHGSMGHGTGMGASASSPAGRLSTADMNFVMTAAGTDMYEIQAAQLAKARGSQPAVRDFAQMLVDHHTQSSSELKGILNAKGIPVAAAIPHDKQVKIERLSRLQGAEFDREFIRVTGVQDHQAAIVNFQQASRDLNDPDLRNFAAKTLPVLQQHLQSAQRIAGTMAG